MKLLLLGNYAPDAQQSMLRFAALLAEGWRARGIEVVELAPPSSALIARLRRLGGARVEKWLGYLDKYVFFPPRLNRAVRAATAPRTLVHVIDHSNALYVPRTPAVPWIVTCHDLLAVRGALGEDTDCPASPLGRQLQRAIVRGLGRASAIAAVSDATLRDVQRIVPAPASRAQSRRTIPLALNHPYRRVPAAEARARLRDVAGVPWAQPFVLHVGSNLGRKNKAAVVRVFARLAAVWPGNLIFCGAPIPEELRAPIAAGGLTGRVFAAPAPDNAQLEAAYSLAHALLFPSRGEGFGWPVIEAQACGCPVVCSDSTSLPEVGGAGALVHALADEAGMAESLRALLEPAARAALIARGTENLARFTVTRMIDAYGALYEESLAVSR